MSVSARFDYRDNHIVTILESLNIVDSDMFDECYRIVSFQQTLFGGAPMSRSDVRELLYVNDLI